MLIQHTTKSTIDNCIQNIFQCPDSVWDKIFEVNVKTALQFSKLVVPHMQKRKGGAIVYISSIGGYQPMKVRYCNIYRYFSRKYFSW